jgi:hypothetical protein
MDKYEINEVDPMEVLIIKLISGDTSDNISSAWSIVKNGRKRGIADKGAKSIFDEYLVQNYSSKMHHLIHCQMQHLCFGFLGYCACLLDL